MEKLNFQQPSSGSNTFKNHSNMLIWCLSITVLLIITVDNSIFVESIFFLHNSLMNRKNILVTTEKSLLLCLTIKYILAEYEY